jgi:hypothetical protein
VTITGDPATKTITVAVTVTGYLPVIPDALERDVNVWLDTDKNSSTGDEGSDYTLDAWNDPSGSWWSMSRWDGSDWNSLPLTPTMGFTQSGDVLSWRLNAADLGGAASFSFDVSGKTFSDASDNYVGDWAPDDGEWTFDLGSAPPATAAPERNLTVSLTPVIGKVAAVPIRPEAGKRLTVSFPVTRSDDHKPLTAGKMTSAVSLTGKPIAHMQSFQGSVARLWFVVPKTAKGKQLTVKLTITAPSYRGKDGTYIDVASGQTGITHVRYQGRSASRTVGLQIR